MARIYQALARKSDGRFDMTVSSDEEHWCHPIGYCAGAFDSVFPEEPTDTILWAYMTADNYAARRLDALPFADRYHDNGHPTVDEARACYDRYRLEREYRAYEDPRQQRRCQICGAWTTNRVHVGSELPEDYTLCADDATPENITAIRARRRSGDAPED